MTPAKEIRFKIAHGEGTLPYPVEVEVPCAPLAPKAALITISKLHARLEKWNGAQGRKEERGSDLLSVAVSYMN